MTSLRSYYEDYWQSRIKHHQVSSQPPLRTSLAIKYIPVFPSRILDLGCGEGGLGKALPDSRHHLTGIDISPTALKLAKPHYHRTITADITNNHDQKKIGDKFDVVISTEVIEHLIYPEKLLQFSFDHLVDNGTLILSFPNTAWWKYRLDLFFQGKFIDETPCYTQNDHVRFFTIHTLKALVEKNGFWVDTIDAVFSLPWYFGRLPQKAQRFIGNLNPNLWGYQVLLICHKLSHKPTVAHFVKDYLNPSEPWIYTQLTSQTKTSPIVLAKNLRLSQLFPATVFKYPLASDGIKPLLFRKIMALWERIRNPVFLTELRFYIRILKHTQTRLIHAHYGSTGYEAIALKHATKLPLVVSFYGSDIHALPRKNILWKIRYQVLWQVADAFLVKSLPMKQKLQSLGCPENKVSVVDHGVIFSNIPFKPSRPTKSPRLLIASRLEPVKGIQYAIRALPAVLKKFPRTSLTIIGSGSQEKSLKKLVSQLKLNSKINFHPFLPQDQLLAMSDKHHLFLHPSITTSDYQQEGIPTTIVERLASGMPVIASNSGDIPVVINHHHTGLLVPEKDSSALSEAIIFLISHPDLWPKLAKNGRQLVKAKYDAVKQTTKREKIYLKLFKP